MLSDKQFDNLKWTELTDLNRLVGATITSVEPLTDGEKEVGTFLYLAHADGTKSVVLFEGDVDEDGLTMFTASIAEVSP